MGTAMAFDAGGGHGPSAMAALVGALLIQVGTNFANDYFDYVKGTDAEGRAGPTRVTQAGLIAPGTMWKATVLVFLLALVPGTYIVWRGGWPFVVIGISSILFAVLYTGGPLPLGYLGLGDVLVLVFFGPVAVGGTYYLQAFSTNWTAITAGLAPGLFSVAILTVNNLRDIEGDRRAGKRTLAVRFGVVFARLEYLLSIVFAGVVIPLVLCAFTRGHWFALSSLLTALLAVPILRTVFKTNEGLALNEVLARTGQLLLLFGVLFSVGWLL
ncbi:MAG: 1,4-dihydroxy-2-naphthoate polyprenyltransferase [Candidatus Hydrogenedentes bacterium]|nr:1,4-dihydroxy-2-naphthoate polyprenyltransferase [Candidatus Hydrogenedentota bacterium]